MEKSAFQKARDSYKPVLPQGLRKAVSLKEGKATASVADQEEIQKMFPNTYGLPTVEFIEGKEKFHEQLNVGVILSGGQAPGGHNVITGLFDTLKKMNPHNRLFGFLLGPGGLVDHKYIEISETYINDFRNTGGFDMIGSGRTKLETVEQFEKGYEILKYLNIKALVIIGGDDSNTNSCVLAEYFKAKNYDVQVIGCPKTIDGDLKCADIETSFGFDTATKVYSELIGNIERDCNSARKYWHFVKLMGRSASHIALECALQCHPNICLVSEEVEQKDMSLNDIIDNICSIVAYRAARGMNYGVALIPEGLIEFIPAIGRLIDELNDLLAFHGDEYRYLSDEEQREYILNHLSEENRATFETLPTEVAHQLSLDRDPHGNVQVSLIETEKLISQMCEARLAQWKKEGKFVGKFSALHHFFGYEGRCAAPSNFDANYCYALGASAAHLIDNGKTGYMAIVRNTASSIDEWTAGGVPITSLLNMERRNGEMKPVIRKALVDLNGRPFKELMMHRDEWSKETSFLYPGPIQYWGPSEVCDCTTKTLALEHLK